MYTRTYVYIYIYIYIHTYTHMYVCVCVFGDSGALITIRHCRNGYLAQRVTSLVVASSCSMCLNCEVVKGLFPWRTRYPLS